MPKIPPNVSCIINFYVKYEKLLLFRGLSFQESNIRRSNFSCVPSYGFQGYKLALNARPRAINWKSTADSLFTFRFLSSTLKNIIQLILFYWLCLFAEQLLDLKQWYDIRRPWVKRMRSILMRGPPSQPVSWLKDRDLGFPRNIFSALGGCKRQRLAWYLIGNGMNCGDSMRATDIVIFFWPIARSVVYIDDPI